MWQTKLTLYGKKRENRDIVTNWGIHAAQHGTGTEPRRGGQAPRRVRPERARSSPAALGRRSTIPPLRESPRRDSARGERDCRLARATGRCAHHRDDGRARCLHQLLAIVPLTTGGGAAPVVRDPERDRA